MTAERDVDSRPLAAVLAEAAGAAGYAPSVHNTQPWRWRVHTGWLDLHAERSRQLTVTDPDGRLMMISCGAALHHALVALRAEGWRGEVTYFPDPEQHDHLARIVPGERIPVTPDAVRMFQEVQIRRTDRRPVSDTSVTPQTLAALEHAAERAGGHLARLAEEQVIRLAAAAAAAQATEVADPQWREELAYWVGGARPEGAGVPAEAIPVGAPKTTVPGRDFGVWGTLPISERHDRAAVYEVLYADGDFPVDWLRSGQVLSEVWLNATTLGVSVLPLSAAVEVADTRAALRHLLADLGYPMLVLRLGIAEAEHPGPPHTPRLPSVQVVDTSEAFGEAATGQS